MTHYLRDNQNRTIVDIEATEKDVRCVVTIKRYSEHLLSMPISLYPQFIADIHAISEIRGEFWETNINNETPDQIAMRRCCDLAKKWNLKYITD